MAKNFDWANGRYLVISPAALATGTVDVTGERVWYDKRRVKCLPVQADGDIGVGNALVATDEQVNPTILTANEYTRVVGEQGKYSFIVGGMACIDRINTEGGWIHPNE